MDNRDLAMYLPYDENLKIEYLSRVFDEPLGMSRWGRGYGVI